MLFIDKRLAQCLGRTRKDGVPRPYARLSSPPRGYQFFITTVVNVSRSNPTSVASTKAEETSQAKFARRLGAQRNRRLETLSARALPQAW
jgi:hypothetical protein